MPSGRSAVGDVGQRHVPLRVVRALPHVQRVDVSTTASPPRKARTGGAPARCGRGLVAHSRVEPPCRVRVPAQPLGRRHCSRRRPARPRPDASGRGGAERQAAQRVVDAERPTRRPGRRRRRGWRPAAAAGRVAGASMIPASGGGRRRCAPAVAHRHAGRIRRTGGAPTAMRPASGRRARPSEPPHRTRRSPTWRSPVRDLHERYAGRGPPQGGSDRAAAPDAAMMGDDL